MSYLGIANYKASIASIEEIIRVVNHQQGGENNIKFRKAKWLWTGAKNFTAFSLTFVAWCIIICVQTRSEKGDYNKNGEMKITGREEKIYDFIPRQ